MRILMIEDDRDLVRAAAMQIGKAGFEIDTAFDGEEGFYYWSEGSYDLILLDRMLPITDGLTLLKKMRRLKNTTPVLMLTALDSIGNKVDGLDAGADDYLAKPFDMRELLARIRALIRRPAPITDTTELRFGDILLDTSALYLEGNKGRCTLSKKETELLAALMKNDGKTLTRNALFARAWGVTGEVLEGGLDSYAYYIRRRLSAVSNTTILVTVRGVGYKLETEMEI